jgi:DNA-binding transcriptional regulator YiaG
MKDAKDYENMSVFEQVKTGLQQSLAHGRGELTLKTTTLPMPPPPASRAKVIELRKTLKMSQSVFAAALNVSTKLVQSWEQGLRKPDRGELRLIQILIKQPEIVSNLILANGPVRRSPKSTRSGRHASMKRAAAA